MKAKVERGVKSFLTAKRDDRYSVNCEITTIDHGFLSFVVKFSNLYTKAIDGYSCFNLNTRTLNSLHLKDLLDSDLSSGEVFSVLVLEQFSKQPLEFDPGLL